MSYLGILRFAGADAIAFLQGQVSNDTRRLQGGAPMLAAYSSAQGRVIAVLHLLPHSSGVMAVLPRELVTPTLERLRKFVLRAKVKIEDLSDHYEVIGAHDATATWTATPGAAASARAPSDTSASGAAASVPENLTGDSEHAGYVERDGIGIARVDGVTGTGSNRYWIIRPADVAPRADAGPTAGAAPTAGATPSAISAARAHAAPSDDAERIERDWRLADIRAGMPRVYAATSEQFVAQMLNLDLIDGISFKKGCYTGQEIIARAQHLGRIKRRMFRLRLPAGVWSIGQAVRLTDGRAGRITELAAVEDGFEALAVLTLEAAAPDADSAPSDAASATELPLPYDLRAQADPVINR